MTHNTPAVIVLSWRVLGSRSRAKLKIKMTNKAKTSMAESSSRLRISADKSFQTTALKARKKESSGLRTVDCVSRVTSADSRFTVHPSRSTHLELPGDRRLAGHWRQCRRAEPRQRCHPAREYQSERPGLRRAP